MRSSIFLAGVTAFAALAAQAQAVELEIDAFDQGNLTLTDDTDDGTAVSSGGATYTTSDGNQVTRTITINLNSRNDTDPLKVAQARVFDGTFSISNDVGVNSTTELTYDITDLADDLIGAGGMNAFLEISVLDADVERMLELFVNGSLQSTFTASDQIEPSDNFTRLMAFDIGALTGTNDTLTLRITGDTNLDYRLTLLAIGNNDVPAPGALGLLGLGMLALGTVRRRRPG